MFEQNLVKNCSLQLWLLITCKKSNSSFDSKERNKRFGMHLHNSFIYNKSFNFYHPSVTFFYFQGTDMDNIERKNLACLSQMFFIFFLFSCSKHSDVMKMVVCVLLSKSNSSIKGRHHNRMPWSSSYLVLKCFTN